MLLRLTLLLSSLLAAAAALQVPSPHSDSSSFATRRSALKQAAAVGATAALPLFALNPAPVSAADQLGSAKSVAEGNELAQGFSGAIRSDIGPSLQGSGIEILVTDLSYTELDEFPKSFFVPAKGGPWKCIEITASAFNQVCVFCCFFSIRHRGATFSSARTQPLTLCFFFST